MLRRSERGAQPPLDALAPPADGRRQREQSEGKDAYAGYLRGARVEKGRSHWMRSPSSADDKRQREHSEGKGAFAGDLKVARVEKGRSHWMRSPSSADGKRQQSKGKGASAGDLSGTPVQGGGGGGTSGCARRPRQWSPWGPPAA